MLNNTALVSWGKKKRIGLLHLGLLFLLNSPLPSFFLYAVMWFLPALTSLHLLTYHSFLSIFKQLPTCFQQGSQNCFFGQSFHRSIVFLISPNIWKIKLIVCESYSFSCCLLMQRGISPSVKHVPPVAWKTILGDRILSIYITLLLIFILMTTGKMWLVPQMCNFTDIIA